MRLALIAFAVTAFAAPAQAQVNRRSASPQPSQRVESRDGQMWDRIQLRYIDVRVITQALGGTNLPTEMDIYRMQLGGGMGLAGGGFGMQGGGFGMPGGGYGMQGGGYGMQGGQGGFVGPGQYGGGPAILGHPATNSVIIGPRGAGGFGGGGFAGPNRVIGDPRSNSVIAR